MLRAPERAARAPRLPAVLRLAAAVFLTAAPAHVRALEFPGEDGPGGFLLFDRPDSGRIVLDEDAPPPPAEAPSPSADFDEFLKGLGDWRPTQADWNEMRRAAEEGRRPTEPVPEGVAVSTASAALPAEEPQSLPPEVESEQYGTSLSVTGRKVIGFNYNAKRFIHGQTHTTRPRSTSLFDINQELQIRMQGKVGPKVTVNVDYDDTKTNKQDISVVYQGDPQEVVQNASFGDIDLSLPATEFVSYNKQLFGIRADLKYGRAKATFIGSRTKGTTKTKRFIGNTQFASANILDTSYIRRQYYELAYGNPARLPIQPASERVWLDLQNPAAENVNTQTLVVDDLGAPSSTYSGRFNLLSPGLDYNVDYARGILTFRNSLPAQAVVAVDFQVPGGTFLRNHASTTTFAGGTGRLKLLKTSNDVPISTQAAVQAAEVGYRRELKTTYAIGQSPIVRDDGRGNFFLKVLDLNRNEVGPSLSPVQRYPDSIEVDFENGLFRLASPFGAAAAPGTPDPDVYSPSPVSKRIFQVEYYFRLKTFFLEPNLVLQSETILVDGRALSRNIDYFVDYDSGFITFFREESIGPNSVIDITYEVAPFGGVGTESLLGTRIGYDVTSNWNIGSTLLYQAAGKPAATPTLRDLPRSLLVYDVDSSIRDLRLLPFLRGSFAAEIAQSQQNPNLSKYALIENMEGVKQEDAASMDRNFWQIASNPQLAPADPLAVAWRNENARVLDIFPNAQASGQDTQQVLAVDYNFTVNGSSEVSIVYPFSEAGLDFTKKNFLELVVFGDASATKLNVHLGSVDENVDGTGGVTLSCSDGTQRVGVPKTEDVNCDSVLQQGEDIGWLYAPSGKNSARFIAGNGRIDSADLNRNGRMDPQDFSGGSFGYVTGSTFTATAVIGGAQTTGHAVSYSGWHTIQVPLGISTANSVGWTAVRQVRLSLRRGDGVSASSGTIRLARVSAVGNLWQQGEVQGSSGTLTVNAVNSSDNPEYVPIFSAGGDAQSVFQQLYGGEQQQAGVVNRVEQSVALTVEDLAAGATALTRRTFTRALDMSQHDEVRFLVYGGADPLNLPPSGGVEVAFLRLGNESNYFEAAVPLPSAPGWRLVTLKLERQGTQRVPTVLVNGSPFNVEVSSVGAPSFQQIAQLTVGLYNRGGVPLSGTVWFNEIHVAQPRIITGNAKKFQADFDMPGWMTFGGKFRFVDQDFQTPTSVITNQDNEQASGYLNFNRISIFPMGFTVQRTITETPSVALTGDNSNLVSLLSEGKVTRWNGTARGTLQAASWPRLSLGYARDYTDYELLTREDDKHTYTGQLTYNVPGTWRVVPRTVDLGYTHTDSEVVFSGAVAQAVPGNYDTLERAHDYTAKLGFAPWQGASINPGYRFTEVHEQRTDNSSGSPARSSYTKSRGQEASLSANLRLLSWLNPSVNYTITTNENANLTPSSRVVQGVPFSFGIAELKSVNRSATGGVTLPLSMGEVFPSWRPMRSFSVQASYQLQDGDSWQDVEKDLNSLPLLSVRQKLDPKSPVAQLQNQTLRDTYNLSLRWSPFEAYTFTMERLAPLQTLTVTNNYTASLERKDVTGTRTRTESRTLPDLLVSMGLVEKMLGTEGWMANGQTNWRFSSRRTETIGQSLSLETAFGADLRFVALRRFDSAMSYNRRGSDTTDLRTNQLTQGTAHQDASVQTTFDSGPWRFTPKVDWSEDQAKASGGRLTQDVVVITPSLLVRADLSIPRGLKLPFSEKVVVLPNRIIWTTTTSYARRRSGLTEADNSDLLTMTTSGDYEIAKNLRMTLNGGFSRLWHKFLDEEDFISYNLGTTLTFQF